MNINRFMKAVTLLVCASFYPANLLASTIKNSEESFTIYLVRHAEKQSKNDASASPKIKDPDLTICGQKRAMFLANLLTELQAVYSTTYKRTRLTAAPTAEKFGLNVQIYNPKVPNEIVKKLLLEKSNALVVGHSNTTNVVTGQSIEKLSESEYDKLFKVLVNGTEIKLQEMEQGFYCKI